MIKTKLLRAIAGCLLVTANSTGAVETEGDEPAAKFGFESGDLTGWKIVSGEFGQIVTDRATFHGGKKAYNRKGKWHLSTLETPSGGKSDSYVGELRSETFKVTTARVNFLIGGGSRGVYVALCTEDGAEVRTETGNGSQEMERVVWSIPELVGEDVFLKIVDLNVGAGGTSRLMISERVAMSVT